MDILRINMGLAAVQKLVSFHWGSIPDWGVGL
jgi:hypothetical protein